MADVAQFAIDIAAQMSGAEQTFAQLDTLSNQLQGGGAKATHFEDAIQRVSLQLDAAGAASRDAAAALADGSAEYKIAERALVQAGKAAEKAAKKNKGVVPDDLQSKVDEAQKAVDKYAAELKDLESTAESTAAEQERLQNTFKNLGKLSTHVKDKLGDATTNLSTFRGALGDVGGPLGEFGEKLLFPAQAFVDLNEKFGATKAAAVVAVVGIAAVAAAVVALNAALVVGVAKLTAWAVKAGDATRAAGLARQALEAMNPTLRGLRGNFTALQRGTGVTEDTLRSLTKSLQDAKVKTADLPRALKAAALAEAALGQGGAAQFIERIKKSKLTVDEFAATTQHKLGGIVAQQMLGLEAQGSRFRQNIASLFGGLNIEPALKGLQVLVALFDENTVAGKAIKFLFEKIFQPLIDQAKAAAVVVEAFAIGFLIGLTKVYITLKPVFKAIEEFFGLEEGTFKDVLSSATRAGELFAKGLVLVVGVLAILGAGIAAVVVALVGIQAAVMMAMQAVVKFGVELVGSVIGAVKSVVAWFEETDFGELGSSVMTGIASGISSAASAVLDAITSAVAGLIDGAKSLLGISSDSTVFAGIGGNLMGGLASGITGAAGAVVGAISGAVSGAIDKAKSLLGIASDSKVFKAIGSFTAGGMIHEVERQTDGVQDAMAAMVEPPDAQTVPAARAADRAATDALGAPAGAASAAASGGGVGAAAGGAGPSLDLSGATFAFYGVEGAEDAEVRFSEVLTRLLEGDVAQLGGAEAAT